MKQKILGSLNDIKELLKRKNMKTIFLVTGKTSFVKSGAQKKVNKIFSLKEKVVKFSGFSVNPKLKEIKRGLKLFQKNDFDIILAIGGGSSIDVAKAIKLFSNKPIPIVAVPTTAGSGSEATYFIVYYIGKDKQSEGKRELTLPNYVILDPTFLKSLPSKVMASSGIDALGQAIESYWSIDSTIESRKYSKKAIKILMKYLLFAVANKDDKSLEKIQKAANLAGKAINITKTTSCHALAYPLTSYFGIRHGHAVGLTLGEMLKFNYRVSKEDCLDKRGVRYVKKSILKISKLIGAKNQEEASAKINKLMKDIGLETKLSMFGLKRKEIRIVTRKGFIIERINNNPRKLTKKEIVNILEKVY